ncbi:MAG: leucine-rich repeat domain-containing protein [Coriobacteriia bacterium]|nr:leucine-rich repeat domain-containing protein [Coriobacteriia bacterium]
MSKIITNTASALPSWSDLIAFEKAIKGLITEEVEEYTDYIATIKQLILYAYSDANRELHRSGSGEHLLYGLAEIMHDRFKQVLREDLRTPSVEELVEAANEKGHLSENGQMVLANSLTSYFQQCQRYVLNTVLYSISSLIMSIDSYFKSIDSAKAMHKEPSKDRGLYYFASDSVGLFGRCDEIKALHKFCEDTNKNLLWWVVAGEGGSGKSKLCYEFSKEMRKEGWSVCWPQYRSESDLDKCSDRLPNDTLFVIDYAEDNIADIGKWITTLSVDKYQHIKIRVLLLQRKVERFDDFADSRIAQNANDENLWQAMYGEPLWLSHLKEGALISAINDFAKHRPDKKRPMTPDSEELILSKLKEIDGVTAFHKLLLLRPLYALILTDAYIQDNDDITSWSITDVHDYVYKNDKKSIRRATRAGCGKIGDSVASDSMIVVAYATIIGEFTVTEKDLEASIPEVYKDLKKREGKEPDMVKLFCENEYLLDFRDEEYVCPPLEPDIIGEYFVLKVLSEIRKKDQRQELIKSAWGELEKTVAFVNRLFRDFTEDMLHDDLAEVLSQLRACMLPDSVTEIGDYTFRDSNYLTSVVMSHVSEIGCGAFHSCTGLTRVEMPTVTEIGDAAFCGCTGLTRVEMPTVTEIGDAAFCGCTSLAGVDMPSVKEIGVEAFIGCTSLTSVDMPSVKEIGYEAFRGCFNLTSVDMSSATEIKLAAFLGCTSLAVVDMPSVKEIGAGAFRGCTGLTSVDMPSVMEIGHGAFRGCTNLLSFVVSSENVKYSVDRDGVLFTKNFDTLVLYPAGKAVSEYSLPDSVTAIGHGAFTGCTGLTSVDMPSVTVIGDFAFRGCTGLTSVEMTSVMEIGHGAFTGCTGLTSVDMPCITVIWDNAFYSCTNLLSFVVSSENVKYSVDRDGVLFTKNYDTLVLYPAGKAGSEYTVPDSVIAIGSKAFAGCTGLTSVEMPSVTAIGAWAFSGCTALISVEMPCVTEIGDWAFYGCTSLVSIEIPVIKEISITAFIGCSSLAKIIINDDNENYFLGESGDALYDKKTGKVVWRKR